MPNSFYLMNKESVFVKDRYQVPVPRKFVLRTPSSENQCIFFFAQNSKNDMKNAQQVKKVEFIFDLACSLSVYP